MKKSLIIISLFLASTFTFAQGTENFANFPETGNSYQDGTFVGQDGSTWTYWQCRGDKVITAETPCLGKDRTPTAEVISGTISNGCGTLSFDYMQAFSTSVNLDVFVNGLLITSVTSNNQVGVVLNSGPIAVNTPGDFIFSFKQHDNGAGQVSIDNITWTAFGGGPLPEPTNYPTSFLATPEAFKVILTWIDAVGAQLPTAYLIKASDQNNIIVPLDGTPVTDDPDLSDGSGAINVIQGVETYSFYNLLSNQIYYFEIFPYTNTGANIDYKVDGTPPAVNALTPNVVIINHEDFNDFTMGPWTIQNVIGPQQFWEIDSTYGVGSSACAKMNGFSGGAQENEDWIISPSMNFDDYINEKLTFETACNYDGPDLEVMISSEYDGVGNPNDYEWEDLTAILSSGGWSWTSSGTINVSGTAGTMVYIAFKYTSDASEAKTWELDEILITGEVEVSVQEREKEAYSFRIYPNPAGEQVTLGFQDDLIKEVEVLSILGSKVKHLQAIGDRIAIPCSGLNPGVYFIRVTSSDGRTGINKLIKE